MAPSQANVTLWPEYYLKRCGSGVHTGEAKDQFEAEVETGVRSLGKFA